MAARTLMLLNPVGRRQKVTARQKAARKAAANRAWADTPTARRQRAKRSAAAKKAWAARKRKNPGIRSAIRKGAASVKSTSRSSAGKKAWATRKRNEAAKKRAATLAAKKRSASSTKTSKKKGGRTSMAKMTKAKRSAAAKKAWRTRKRKYGKAGLTKGKKKAAPKKRRVSRGPGGRRGTKARAKGKYHRPRVYRAKSGRWYRKKPGTRGKSYSFPRKTRLNPRRKYRRNPLPTMKQLLDPKKMIAGIKLGASVLGGYAIINTFDTQISSRIASKVTQNPEAHFWLSTLLNAMGTIVISHFIRGSNTKLADAVMAGGFFVVTKDIVMKVMPAAANLIEGQGMGGFLQSPYGSNMSLRGFAQIGETVGPSQAFGSLEYDGM